MNALPEALIEYALSRSTFEAVKTVEDRMLADGNFDRRVNNAGVPYEYRTHFDAAMHAAIGGGGQAIYDWLRYEPPKHDAVNSVSLQPQLRWVNLAMLPLVAKSVEAAITMYQNNG